jgi:hypothetical protein
VAYGPGALLATSNGAATDLSDYVAAYP